MLPSLSHGAPTIPVPLSFPGGEGHVLANAFTHFVEAAARLESSYRELQQQVHELGSELAARNRELEGSLHAQQTMRLGLVALLDALPCGVVVLHAPLTDAATDAQQIVPLRMNPEAARLLGVDLQGAHDLDSIAERTGVHLLHFCSLEGESKITIQAPGCEKRWLGVRARRLGSSPTGMEVVLILSDMSAQMQAEQERDAGRRAMALAEVAATLAHEVRNPLGSLELFATLLEEQPGDAALWLGHLRAGLRSLNGTVSNVLAFHGHGQIRLQRIELSRALTEAAGFVRPIAEQAHLSLITSGLQTPGCVEANAASLQQLLLNLVSNAVRFSQPGGTVELALTKSSSTHLTLSVADRGCGIAPEDLAHIFIPGWSRAGQSTGLGLAICQSIARQHRSELTVQSVPGRGTTFSMELEQL
jgi:two-component system, sensor histidine kinase FlrB